MEEGNGKSGMRRGGGGRGGTEKVDCKVGGEEGNERGWGGEDLG